MKKIFTYSLALIGMMMCSIGANAQETTKYSADLNDLTVAVGGNVTYDATTHILSWTKDGDNVVDVKFTGLPEGPMPSGTKFVVKATLAEGSKAFRMFIDGSGKTDCTTGVNEFVLDDAKEVSRWRFGGTNYSCGDNNTTTGSMTVEEVYIIRPNGTAVVDPLPSIIEAPAAGSGDNRISVDMATLPTSGGNFEYDPATHAYTCKAQTNNLIDLDVLKNMDSKYKRVVVNVSYYKTNPETCRFCTGDGSTLRKVLLKEGVNEIEITSADDLSRVRIGGTDGGQKFVIHYIYADTNTATAINNVAVESAADAQLYNAAGQKVGKNYKGLVMQKNGKKWMQK